MVSNSLEVHKMLNLSIKQWKQPKDIWKIYKKSLYKKQNKSGRSKHETSYTLFLSLYSNIFKTSTSHSKYTESKVSVILLWTKQITKHSFLFQGCALVKDVTISVSGHWKTMTKAVMNTHTHTRRVGPPQTTPITSCLVKWTNKSQGNNQPRQ